jgi:hypothetical protein
VRDAARQLRAVGYTGVITREASLQAKLWRAVFPTVPLYVVRADGREVRRYGAP